MKNLTRNDIAFYQKVDKKNNTEGGDRVFKRNGSFQITDYSLRLLRVCQDTYQAGAEIRKRTRRNYRYYRGDQWSDVVEVNGMRMTEEEYIKMQGKPAFKQNLIRPPVRNLIGQFRSNPFKSVVYSTDREGQVAAEMMTIALESVHFDNDQKERDTRLLEEFLLSGVAIYVTKYDYDQEKMRSIPQYSSVNLNRFFCDVNSEDVMGKDVKIIGEICDSSLLDVISAYAKDETEQSFLMDIFNSTDSENILGTAYNGSRINDVSFLTPSNPGMCRIIKVCVKRGAWKLLAHDRSDGSYESYEYSEKHLLDKEIENRKRLAEENGVYVPELTYEKRLVHEWHYYHLSTQGHILWHSISPYEHNSHPYVFKFYPMLNGAVWSMVEDAIDQQRMINRMIILQDFIISASSKGVLLVPEEVITEDFPIERIAEEWTKYNGIIKIKNKPGVEMPKQIVSNAIHAGAHDFINMQIKLMQDVNGVYGAMQGKTPESGTPAARYAQEAMNASINILDYLESFASFLQKRDLKIVQLIKQYYQDKIYIAQGNKNVSQEAKIYDPDKIRNVQFDTRIGKGTDTPAYRMMIDDMLYKLLEGRLISMEMFLEHTSYPFADKLLQTIKRQREQLQQGQVPEGIPNEVMNEIPQSSADGLNGVNKLMGGANNGNYSN